MDSSPRELTISLDGRDTRVELRAIPINRLVLDEENPRISFFKDNQVKPNLTEQDVEYALTSGNTEAWRKLKDSIHNNRGVVTPIWVEPMQPPAGELFRVIEGNSRVLACRKLMAEEPHEPHWQTILAYVLPREVSGEQKNFVRLLSHLRGATDWDAYEKAKYLYRLWDRDGWTKDRLEKQTKMTRRQIDDNIGAYRLMSEQYLPRYGTDPEEVSKFSYFVEYVKDRKLQQLFDQYAGGTDGYCRWVNDRTKIPTGQDVRKLRPILENDDSRKVILRRGFDAALEVLALRAPHVVSGFYRDVESVVRDLQLLSLADMQEIADDESGGRLKLLEELAEWSRKVLASVRRS